MIDRLKWDKILCSERLREGSINKSENDMRNEFEGDYNRIIFSSAFRRLQDKTQVFPLEDSDFVRTRLTHSLEVATIAESIGVSLEEILISDKDDFNKKNKGKLSKVLACSGLLHDIGNTPFGHFGEYAIQQFFKNCKNDKLECLSKEERMDFENFDGNAQALRIITSLQSMGKEFGMNLTVATLSSIIKYPRSSSEGYNKNKGVSYKKYGYLQSEENIFKNIIEKTGLKNNSGKIVRSPIVFILEAADDIAYSVSDIEDGLKKGLLTLDYLKESFFSLFNGKAKSNSKDEDKKVILEKENLLKMYKEKILKDFRIIIENGNENEFIEKLNYNELLILSKFYEEIQYGNSDDDYIRAQLLRVVIQGYMISSVIDAFIKNYDKIMLGEYEKELIYDSEVKSLRKNLKDITVNKIFGDKDIIKNELAGEKVITKLLNVFVACVLEKDDKKCQKTNRIYQLISENYRKNYDFTDKQVYNKVQLAVDFISGMTDNYALELYKQLQGIII